MRIPVINSDPRMHAAIAEAMERSNAHTGPRRRRADHIDLLPHALGAYQQALDHISYQTPPLLLVNFSDPAVRPFELMEAIAHDPWLNHGGIVATYSDTETFERIGALQDANIIIALSREQIPGLLPTVLRILKTNTQILFQRTMQSGLISSITGSYTLGLDLQLVPCYANLVANYLYTMGLVDPPGKHNVALVLTEMLHNAIEHGSCEIGSAGKATYIDEPGGLTALVARRAAEPAIAGRKVYFQYEIRRDRSRFVIRDEGPGFDWRAYLDERDSTVDVLAEHGRGILLAHTVADELTYADEGREVTLVFNHLQAGKAVPAALQDNEVVHCRAGDVIFREGEESSFLYYVSEGRYSVIVGGRRVATIRPDDMLMGEMSFLLEETRSATVIAEAPGKLIRISKEAFVDIIKNQPYYGLFLSKLLARRLNDLSHTRFS